MTAGLATEGDNNDSGDNSRRQSNEHGLQNQSSSARLPISNTQHGSNNNTPINGTTPVAMATEQTAIRSGGNAHSLEEPINSDWSPLTSTPAPRKKGWPRGRKRRCLPKDAPKAPLSGYMLYMAEQRELLRHSASPPSFAELAKIVAHQWAAMNATEKQKFLVASDVEKERYHKEMEAYTQTSTYKTFMEEQKQLSLQMPKSNPNQVHKQLPPQQQHHHQQQQQHHDIVTIGSDIQTNGVQQENKRPRKEFQQLVSPVNTTTITNNSRTNGDTKADDDLLTFSSNSPLEIPIFTDQFLKHNKAREAELRQLRKSNSDYEEQNALLQKHIESARRSVEQTDSETAELKTKKLLLSQHLSGLRADLATAFAATPAPGWSCPPTPANIDEYLMSLHAAMTASPPATQSRAAQQAVQQIVTGLILQ